jgi:hypothetical protein
MLPWRPLPAVPFKFRGALQDPDADSSRFSCLAVPAGPRHVRGYIDREKSVGAILPRRGGAVNSFRKKRDKKIP